MEARISKFIFLPSFLLAFTLTCGNEIFRLPRHAGSSVATSWDPGSGRSRLHWGCRVSATGPQGAPKGLVLLVLSNSRLATFSPCPFVVFPPCTHIFLVSLSVCMSSTYKNTSDAGLGSILKGFILTRSPHLKGPVSKYRPHSEILRFRTSTYEFFCGHSSVLTPYY